MQTFPKRTHTARKARKGAPEAPFTTRERQTKARTKYHSFLVRRPEPRGRLRLYSVLACKEEALARSPAGHA